GAMSVAKTSGPVLWQLDDDGVAKLIFNRADVHNAYNGDVIAGVLAALDAFETASGLRAILITGNGRHFQAGADLKWVNEVRLASSEENVGVSRATPQAIRRLNAARVPTVALV